MEESHDEKRKGEAQNHLGKFLCQKGEYLPYVKIQFNVFVNQSRGSVIYCIVCDSCVDLASTSYSEGLPLVHVSSVSTVPPRSHRPNLTQQCQRWRSTNFTCPLIDMVGRINLVGF